MSSVSRRRVLAGLGAVGAAAAIGTGATVAMLRDAEALPSTVVESGDVRFVDCATGERPSFGPLSLSFDAPGFTDEATVGPFGGETVPSWLVIRVCPPTETVQGSSIADYLTGSTVSVTGAAPVSLGHLVSVPLDPADQGACGDQVSVTVTGVLDAVSLDADGLADTASGLSLDLQIEAYLVQQTGVSEDDARSVFTATFGPCESWNDSNGGNDENGNSGNDENGNSGNDENGNRDGR
jgi:hypothetical protein